MLESTDQNTAGIAHACGYRSVESFRAAFRNAVGLAPSAYRERFGSGEISKQAAWVANC